MSLHCPKCNGFVYSRRHKLCGFCGAELPSGSLFTEAELQARARDEAEAEQRRKQNKAKEEAQDADYGDGAAGTDGMIDCG